MCKKNVLETMGDRQNRGLRLVIVIYNPTAITLLAVGQHRSPSCGASLDFTGLQIHQEKKHFEDNKAE